MDRILLYAGIAPVAAVPSNARTCWCLEPSEFMKIAGRAPDPLSVAATGGVFTKNYQYLMGYKGLAFYTKSGEPLALPANAELIAAKGIWIPG